VLDTLELNGRRRLLVVALAYRRRALPIRWRIDRTTGVTGASLQHRFARELAELVPTAADVVLRGAHRRRRVPLRRTAS